MEQSSPEYTRCAIAHADSKLPYDGFLSDEESINPREALIFVLKVTSEEIIFFKYSSLNIQTIKNFRIVHVLTQKIEEERYYTLENIGNLYRIRPMNTARKLMHSQFELPRLNRPTPHTDHCIALFQLQSLSLVRLIHEDRRNINNSISGVWIENAKCSKGARGYLEFELPDGFPLGWELDSIIAIKAPTNTFYYDPTNPYIMGSLIHRFIDNRGTLSVSESDWIHRISTTTSFTTEVRLECPNIPILTSQHQALVDGIHSQSDVFTSPSRTALAKALARSVVSASEQCDEISRMSSSNFKWTPEQITAINQFCSSQEFAAIRGHASCGSTTVLAFSALAKPSLIISTTNAGIDGALKRAKRFDTLNTRTVLRLGSSMENRETDMEECSVLHYARMKYSTTPCIASLLSKADQILCVRENDRSTENWINLARIRMQLEIAVMRVTPPTEMVIGTTLAYLLQLLKESTFKSSICDCIERIFIDDGHSQSCVILSICALHFTNALIRVVEDVDQHLQIDLFQERFIGKAEAAITLRPITRIMKGNPTVTLPQVHRLLGPVVSILKKMETSDLAFPSSFSSTNDLAQTYENTSRPIISFMDSRGPMTWINGERINKTEAEWALRVATTCGEGESIAILCYYRSQMMFVRRLINSNTRLRAKDSLKVCTVDSSESIAADTIIILVSNDICSRNDFVCNYRRFVLAITRAAQSIYVFGNMSELISAKPFHYLIQHCIENKTLIREHKLSALIS